MEFLEDLFDFGDRKHKKRAGLFGQGEYYDDDDHHGDDHQRPFYPGQPPQTYPANPVMPATGLFCARCSTQLAPGAKFCHQCGLTVEIKTNCVSCGSQLPPGAQFCPQCGYKSGA